jgi:hypothetical protein
VDDLWISFGFPLDFLWISFALTGILSKKLFGGVTVQRVPQFVWGGVTQKRTRHY